jgi:hypothetical protein
VTGVGCGMVGDAGVCHSVDHICGGPSAINLKEPTRDYRSHSLNHGVQDGGCYGGCCCGVLYRAPPMDGPLVAWNEELEGRRTGTTAKR